MRGGSLYLLLFSVVLAKAINVKSCKYWCKMGGHQYYCCPSGKSESWSEHGWHSFFFPWFWLGVGEAHVGEPHVEPSWLWKPKKQCPPLRAQCPRTYEWYKPPEFCDSDHECAQWEKCCYDVCLEHKTCKDVE